MLMGNTKELVDSKLLGAINYLETPFILLISYSLIIFGYYIKIF